MGGYRPQLDSLRAFAVSTVLVTHFWLYQSHLSTFGVRLFFVLSGFLLTSILLNERKAASASALPRTKVLVDFYARRILRIWPAYYAALIAALIAGATGMAATFGWHALFASNLLFALEQQFYPPVTAHLWTLSVEEQFYLLLPLMILFLPMRLLSPILIGCIALAILYRAVLWATVPRLDFYFILPVAQLDALCGGALMAVARQKGKQFAWTRALAWSGPAAVLLDLLPVSDAFRVTVTAPVYVVAMAAVIWGASDGIGGPLGALLSSRPIVAIGRISYGIYLYHLFVAAAVDSVIGRFGVPPLGGAIAFIELYALTIAVAAASWFLLERPALSLRGRFRRAAQIGTLVPAAPTAPM